MAASNEVSLVSPDQALAITFGTKKNAKRSGAGGELKYSVSFGGKPLISPSALGLELIQHAPVLGSNVEIIDSHNSAGEDSYTLVSGKTRVVCDRYNQVSIQLKETLAPYRLFAIEARAYKEAVAFRYLVPEQPGLHDFKLLKEITEFHIVKDPVTWSLLLPNYRSGYESEFINLPASALSNQGGVHSELLVGLPLLSKVAGVGWTAIMEAGMRGTCAMYLVNQAHSWTDRWFSAHLAPHIDDPDLCVSGPLPYHSAWRVVMAATDPGRFIESNVVTDLNAPQAIQNTDWIRPGKASWNWWNGSIGAKGQAAYTTETMKYYVDFAAKSKFEYMLVDAGWSAHGDATKMNGKVDIPELVRFARERNVKIWIWLYSKDVWNRLDEAFAVYEKWGVAGVKLDFVLRDDQEGIDFYYKVAEGAARHHLMVDFHGCTKPTGMDRTYPNVMGYEAVLGLENNKAGGRDTLEYRTTIPFTRMIAGRMDYTPGGFDNVPEEDFQARDRSPMVRGTRAQQLAMYVVYESPFQMVSDCPVAYTGQPEFQFIQDVPATWDETKVLYGSPGQEVAIARRAGSDWYLGMMTNRQPRAVELPLSFLGDHSYNAEIYADAQDSTQFPKHVSITRKTVSGRDHLKIELASGGGCAVRFHAGGSL